MELQIVNTNFKYAKATLTTPAESGYIQLAAKVSPPSRPGPIIRRGDEQTTLVDTLKTLAPALEQLGYIESVAVFEAVAFPPLDRLPYVSERRDSVHIARFDVVVLIETVSPAVVADVRAEPAYSALLQPLEHSADDLHVITARNAKRIGDVDKSQQGTFIFNYFVADDAAVMLELYDYLAGWYEAETGLDNSLLLVPLEGEQSDYVAINHAHWDLSVPRFLWRQLSKSSFRNYVLANLKANRVGAMPVLYRLA